MCADFELNGHSVREMEISCVTVIVESDFTSKLKSSKRRKPVVKTFNFSYVLPFLTLNSMFIIRNIIKFLIHVSYEFNRLIKEKHYSNKQNTRCFL